MRSIMHSNFYDNLIRLVEHIEAMPLVLRVSCIAASGLGFRFLLATVVPALIPQGEGGYRSSPAPRVLLAAGTPRLRVGDF